MINAPTLSKVLPQLNHTRGETNPEKRQFCDDMEGK